MAFVTCAGVRPRACGALRVPTGSTDARQPAYTAWSANAVVHGHVRRRRAAMSAHDRGADGVSIRTPDSASGSIGEVGESKDEERDEADEKTKDDAEEASGSVTRRYAHVSWGEVESLCERLARRIRAEYGKQDVVLAVTRGGMVPATMLAQALELRNILTATVIFYKDNGDQFFGMTEPRFLSFPAADALAGQAVLVVDDVWDSGRTASAVRKRVERAEPKSVVTAVLHFKPTQSTESGGPDVYAEDANDWIIYPWERMSPHHQLPS